MSSEELCKMFNRFNVNSNNRDDEIREVFRCSSASSNKRDDNYVER